MYLDGLASPSPLPTTGLSRGVGKKWIFSFTSRSFGYGYEAVRIRVNFKIIVILTAYG
jgi:hypothetical protein